MLSFANTDIKTKVGR